MLVTPGNQTEVLGETLLVDNNDSSVSYEGDWVRTSLSEIVARNAEVRMPIVNSTMRSNSPGASVSFPFMGTAVSVFGSCGREQDISNVDVYLDGVLAPKTAPNHDEVRHTVSPLFSVSGLSKASHTLKLLLISNDSASTNLSIDHFTYAPSFPSFGTKRITNRSPTAPTNEVLIFSTPTHSPSVKPNGARLAGLIFGVIGIALFLALLIFRRRIFRRRARPPPETRPFALGSHRKDATAEQTPQKQEQRLSPNTTGRPLRGILKNQSESRPVLEVKALPHETDLSITGKAIEINSPTLPVRKESSSQPLSDVPPLVDQASPV
ncbi:hypothetical protein C0993_009177 [Termitomyces sp. T159_Od127]|nr:hypothetical protein C0993_009177 [Termitomyces sp. T159_Od127]